MTTAFQPSAFQNNAFQIDSDQTEVVHPSMGGITAAPNRLHAALLREDEDILLMFAHFIASTRVH